MRIFIKHIIMLISIVSIAPSYSSEDSCLLGNHAVLPNISEFNYHKARKALIKAGWKPLRTKPEIRFKPDFDISYGNGALFWKLGYIELEHCSGTGLAPCTFLFKDSYGNKLRVITNGEESLEDMTFAMISATKFICELSK